jgi:hypothetical protein
VLDKHSSLSICSSSSLLLISAGDVIGDKLDLDRGGSLGPSPLTPGNPPCLSLDLLSMKAFVRTNKRRKFSPVQTYE